MRRAAVAITAVLCAAVAGLAQEPAAQKPQFRSGVEVVRLDVSVLDRNRRPVRGLTVADFSVTVDGVEQPISAVSEIDAPNASALPDGWMRDIAPDVHTNDRQHPRLFVLLLDDAHVPWQPVFIDTTRKIAQAFVDRMGPNDLAAVVFTGINKYAVDFTNDRATLSAAIERFTSIVMPACLRLTYTIRTLNQIVTLLSEQPGARASVIFVSVGPPADATEEARSCYPGLRFMEDDAQALFSAHLLSGSTISNVNNVRIYGISPAGLIAPGPTRSGMLQPADSERGGDFLRSIADATGGRAVVNTNTPETSAADIIEENSTYYVVGYRPTYDQSQPRTRRIKVGVRHPDVMVLPSDRRVRTKPQAQGPGTSSATDGLARLIPSSDLPMRMALTAMPGAHIEARKGHSELIVTLNTAVPASELARAATRDVEVRVFDPEGKELAVQRGELALANPETALTFTLPKGRYNVRAAARDRQAGTVGSVFGAIELVDYRRRPLTMAAWVALKQGDAPTVRREFGSGEAPAVHLRLRQGDRGRVRDARLVIDVIDRSGEVVHSGELLVSAREFDVARTIEMHRMLPVSSLAPGPYLLRLTASLAPDAEVRQQIRFERR